MDVAVEANENTDLNAEDKDRWAMLELLHSVDAN